ncbi:hypothetical protein Tco_0373915 [Tanacetum coccineum]
MLGVSFNALLCLSEENWIWRDFSSSPGLGCAIGPPIGPVRSIRRPPFRYGVLRVLGLLTYWLLGTRSIAATFPVRATSGLRPYHFTYPERKLTMEEILYKFIKEGKQEHEEMRAFICDFQTTNKILFKEQNNSLIELRFGVQELLRVINNTPTIDCEVKGVTTRGGKTTTQGAQNDDTSVHTEESKRLRKEKEEAQQKMFLENLKQLHINLPFIEADVLSCREYCSTLAALYGLRNSTLDVYYTETMILHTENSFLSLLFIVAEKDSIRRIQIVNFLDTAYGNIEDTPYWELVKRVFL